MAALKELKELSLPPPGPFGLQCPQLKTTKHDYDGTTYTVFLIKKDRVEDFRTGYATESDITRYTKGTSKHVICEVRAFM